MLVPGPRRSIKDSKAINRNQTGIPRIPRRSTGIRQEFQPVISLLATENLKCKRACSCATAATCISVSEDMSQQGSNRRVFLADKVASLWTFETFLFFFLHLYRSNGIPPPCLVRKCNQGQRRREGRSVVLVSCHVKRQQPVAIRNVK